MAYNYYAVSLILIHMHAHTVPPCAHAHITERKGKKVGSLLSRRSRSDTSNSGEKKKGTSLAASLHGGQTLWERKQEEKKRKKEKEKIFLKK